MLLGEIAPVFAVHLGIADDHDLAVGLLLRQRGDEAEAAHLFGKIIAVIAHNWAVNGAAGAELR